MLADEVDYVVGVDTHRDQHVLAVVAAPTGALIAQRAVRRIRVAMRRPCVSRSGTRRELASGRSRARATTGPGSPAISIAMAAARGRPHQTGERRLRGKDDPLDAVRAARTGTRERTTTATPRSGQRQEALRVLLLACRSAVDVRRVALVQLRSVIVTAPY